MSWVRSGLGVCQTPNPPETLMYKGFSGCQVRRLGIFPKNYKMRLIIYCKRIIIRILHKNTCRHPRLSFPRVNPRFG